MATYLLVSVNVHTPPTSSDLLQYDVIDVYWDTVSSAITVNKNGVAWGGSPGGYFGDIETNYSVSGITSYEGEYAVSGYSFCSGADLKWFRMPLSYASFPYIEQQTTTDSPVCGTAVCDIHFVGPPDVTHTTDLLSNNGQIVALAESSNGTVKYGLSNFNYSTEGQTSGTITGLAPGTYTLYAKDANDCTAQIQVTILFKPAYAEHYHFAWSSIPMGSGASLDYRVRIYEREYIGDVVEIDHGGQSPFVLAKPRTGGHINDKFFPIHTTNAVLTLMSEVHYQFLPLYTEDDRKYRVVCEVDEGSGYTPIWQGFILPAVYMEDFIDTPYEVQLSMADNVKRLEKALYTDDNGNLLNGKQKLIKIIAFIMKKTGLELNIRSGINIFEANHTTLITDDPLDQTYVDVACYRKGTEPFNCWDVLEKILRPFGARIYQCDNHWIIEEIDQAVASYAYRVFDVNGDYVSNSAFDPIMDLKSSSYLNRVVPVDENQTMSIIPAYGSISITSKLNYTGSIVTGGFEKQDLLSPESEITTYFPGIFLSDEGFRDWSLRYNGTQGVSFGRSVVLGQDNTQSFRRISDADQFDETSGRSVGAFFFNASSWSGNLRDAYIESAAKNLQYGPNDEARIAFDYSTPGGGGEYPFMVLRFALKVGDKYLQQDLSWSTTEHVYRAYPQISSTLQAFELFVKLPDTGGAVVDSTIQVRIYYYAKDFYSFGLPSATSDPANGTDGEGGANGLRALPTVGINYDYRADVRGHVTISSPDSYIREFVELRISDEAEGAFKVIHPNDFNATTNPKIWWVLSHIMENTKTLNPQGHNHRDRIFYVDNVNVDAFVNGQEPPKDETIDHKISKYIDEKLEVELYNFDLPGVRNAKNMYNNYFRLSNGTPTSSWARSGIGESLKLQQILLKVLGANHSAPTFRLHGSFLNEFSRIGINNYLRVTKPGSTLAVTNTDFATDLTGWQQAGSGTAFAWTADNSGSAAVTLTGATDSQKIYQDISHNGGYIQITGSLQIVPATGNDREDILWAVFYRGSSIIHAEKLRTFQAPTGTTTDSISHKAFAPGSITGIGLYIQNINGTGECTYRVTQFAPAGVDIQEVYQITDYQFDTRNNEYTLDLMQISKTYISLSAIDTGGTNQSGGTTGRAHSSGHSSGFN
jgi:hypothetical protein